MTSTQSERRKLKKLLQSLPLDKSPGIDGIPNRILQAGGENLLSNIVYLLQNIWEIETYPEEWTKALMQPIYKGAGKDRKNPESYRRICLTCAITKLFEGLIQNRLQYVTAEWEPG